MFKKVILIIIFLGICSNIVYPIIIDTDNTKGLYINGSCYIYYRPANYLENIESSWFSTEWFNDIGTAFSKGWNEVSLNANMFYRIPLWNPNKVLFADTTSEYNLFDKTKFEVGIEDRLGITGNVLSAYMNFVPINFFSFRVRGGMLYYSTLVEYHGFYAFDSADVEYNTDVFYNIQAETKTGYFFEIEPTLKFAV